MGWSAFRPTGNTIAIDVTTVASVAVRAPSSQGEPESMNYVVSNASTQGVFLAVGPSAGLLAVAPVSATPNNGFWIGGSTTQPFTFANDAYFSAIAPTGTSTLYITPGDGL
jgi:hypothetical protein